MPSLQSSPWVRGAPHSGFDTLISRMSWRISSGVLGRPPRGLDFQRQQARNPARCSDDGLRLEDFHRIQHLGSQVIEPRKHQAIDVSDADPLGRPTPQRGPEGQELRFARLRATFRRNCIPHIKRPLAPDQVAKRTCRPPLRREKPKLFARTTGCQKTGHR
jgi:hypothetical protein